MQHDFILLDRSGSMNKLWSEALGSVNSYVKKLADEKVDTGVTLAAFDFDCGVLAFDIVRDRITPPTWRAVSDKDCTPRGGTPLNDAIVKLVGLAMAGNYDRVAIIIMTDGEENQSREDRTGAVARKMLDECRAKGWQVIFLGVDFDNARQARSANNDVSATLSASAGNLGMHVNSIAGKRAVYGATGQSMGFTPAEKAELNKKP